MSLLFRVLFANKCTSTHHKLAMDALRHLQHPLGEQWTRLFLKNIEIYLDGSKAPDKKFKDFRNHVLHVRENFWGGAVVASERWYGRLVSRLKEQDWPNAIYAAGVLSHYVSDPFMPLHTGQTEDEGAVHRAIEWGCAKAYSGLVESYDTRQNWPDISLPTGEDWLALTVVEGAQFSNRYYETLIDHYDLAVGVKKPAAGFNETSAAALYEVLGRTVITWSRILDRAFNEAGVTPPDVSVSLSGFLTSLSIPIFWVTKNLANAADKKAVRAIYREVQMRGKAVNSLPDDEKNIRALHAEEVLGVDVSVLDDTPPSARAAKFVVDQNEINREKMFGRHDRAQEEKRRKNQRESKASDNTRPVEGEAEIPENFDREYERERQTQRDSDHDGRDSQDDVKDDSESINRFAEQDSDNSRDRDDEREDGRDRDDQDDADREDRPRTLRFYLEPSDPVVDAPSIGGGTAKRLRRAKVRKVIDLLECDPEEVATTARASYITPDNIREWQRQSALMIKVPGLRGHDAQILVACDLDDPAELAAYDPETLLDAIDPFVNSPAGESVIRSGNPPDLQEVTNWIDWAAQSRELRDAA